MQYEDELLYKYNNSWQRHNWFPNNLSNVKVDKGTEERISVCLIKSGLTREDLPEDLSTITYPVSQRL